MTRGLLQSDDGPLEPVEQASTLEAVGLCSEDVRDTASQFIQSSIIRLNEQTSRRQNRNADDFTPHIQLEHDEHR